MNPLSKFLIAFALIVSKCRALKEDEDCVQVSGEPGICIPLHGCEYALERKKKNIEPQICGSRTDQPLVCCPTYAIKSKKQCGIYHRYSYDALVYYSQGGILGGENALSEEFPHMAALGYGNKSDIHWNCGGSLISEEYVLTAAHCLTSKDYGPVKFVRLGDIDLNSTIDKTVHQDFEVQSYVRHPNYKAPSRYHDIGLIKLDRPAKFTIYVLPACLNTRTNLTFENPFATGWGRLSINADTSTILQKVKLRFYDFKECQDAYSRNSKRHLSHGISDETQVCAGSFTNQPQDTCAGDSGGPLQIQHEKEKMQWFSIAGITSFGKGCGLINFPGVYTRVSYYIPWIESIVWPN